MFSLFICSTGGEKSTEMHRSSMFSFTCWVKDVETKKKNKYMIRLQIDTLDVCLTFSWLQHTWQNRDRAWRVLTPFTSVFSSFFTSFSSCQSHELMDVRKAGEELADQRRRPQVWTGVWVHCHAGMEAVPGAQLQGVALTRMYTCTYTQPPSLEGRVEFLWKLNRALL